jgi:hypothetical protein
MAPMPRQKLGLAVSALAALGLLIACSGGTGQPSSGKTPAQLLAQSGQAFTKVDTFTMAGSFQDGDTTYVVDVDVSRTATASKGKVRAGTRTLENMLYVNGKAYISGPDVTRAVDPKSAKIVGDRPLKLKNADTDSIASAVRLTGATAFIDAFLTNRPDLKSAGTTMLDGVKVIKLSDKNGTLYLAADESALPVRVESTDVAGNVSRYQSVRIGFSNYGKPLTLAAPVDYVNFDDDKTLPAYYEVVSWDWDNCNGSGCGARVTVKNDNGAIAPPQAPSITFTVTADSNHAQLGTCSAPIPMVGNGQTAVVGCRITTSAFIGYYANGGAYSGDVVANNPVYD